MHELKPAKPVALQRIDDGEREESANLVARIRSKVGTWEEFRTNRAVSKMAGRALREVHSQKINADTRLANTAISIAEVQMATAMVGRAVPIMAGSMERLNAQANASDQAYTAQEAAAVQSHFHARRRNRDEIERDSRACGLSEQETNAAISFAEANMADDISRTRARTVRCKQAAEALYERALDGILAVRMPRFENN